MVKIQLPSTKTHACRECAFESDGPGIGRLVIREGNSSKSMRCTGRYGIIEAEPTYCRRFQFFLDEQGTYYWVGISTDDEQTDSCFCTGFEQYGYCKHVQIMRLLIERGYFQARPARVTE